MINLNRKDIVVELKLNILTKALLNIAIFGCGLYLAFKGYDLKAQGISYINACDLTIPLTSTYKFEGYSQVISNSENFTLLKGNYVQFSGIRPLGIGIEGVGPQKIVEFSVPANKVNSTKISLLDFDIDNPEMQSGATITITGGNGDMVVKVIGNIATNAGSKSNPSLCFDQSKPNNESQIVSLNLADLVNGTALASSLNDSGDPLKVLIQPGFNASRNGPDSFMVFAQQEENNIDFSDIGVSWGFMPTNDLETDEPITGTVVTGADSGGGDITISPFGGTYTATLNVENNIFDIGGNRLSSNALVTITLASGTQITATIPDGCSLVDLGAMNTSTFVKMICEYNHLQGLAVKEIVVNVPTNLTGEVNEVSFVAEVSHDKADQDPTNNSAWFSALQDLLNRLFLPFTSR